jgi:DNA-binding NarL/FixJ family response regulator
LRIRIVIADDQRIGREGLSALFATAPDMEILGEAECDHSLIEMTRNLSPDVVLMGLDNCGTQAVDTTQGMLQVKPSVRVIGLSRGFDGRFVRDFLTAGGAGFITRLNGFPDFLAAVRSVMNQRVYLSQDVAERMVDQYVLHPTGEDAGLAALSPRQREVLQLVAEGRSTKEAAATLGISNKTVDMHRQHIMNKLQLHSIAELTKYAIREGITSLHSEDRSAKNGKSNGNSNGKKVHTE